MRRFRRSTRFASGSRKKAVWVNIPFGAMAFTETVGNQDLLVPEDWEASFTGLTQERAVLRAIVGELHFIQTVVGTAGGDMFWGLYMAGANETAVPVFTTSGMSEVVWLRVGSKPTSNVITQTMIIPMAQPEFINVKAKRKLDTRTKIALCAQFGADAASPAGSAGGILRFLIARD